MSATQTPVAPLPGLGIEEDPERAAGTSSDGPPVVVVPGRPRPWKRTGFNRTTGAHFATRKDLAAREPVAVAWVQQTENYTFGDAPVRIAIEFVFERPASHFGTGRNAHLLKPSAARFPGKNLGDLDNLTKLVKDALNGVAYLDDSQIVGWLEPNGKRWAAPGERTHTRVEIRRA